MPLSHNGLKTTTGLQVFSQVNKYTLSYQFLYGNVQGCVFAKKHLDGLYHKILALICPVVEESFKQQPAE